MKEGGREGMRGRTSQEEARRSRQPGSAIVRLIEDAGRCGGTEVEK